MKTNSLSLAPDMVAELGECAVGDTKEVMVTITVDAKDDTGLSGTITAVEPYETEPEVEEVEPEMPSGSGSKALKAALA